MDTSAATEVHDLDVRVDQRAFERLPAGGDPAATLELVRHEAFRLPVLRKGPPVRRLPQAWQGVGLRLQAALWEVAARADIRVTPGTSIDEAARLLVGHGAIIPPAGDAVRALAAVVEAACAGEPASSSVRVDQAAAVAERLAGYLALRAHFG